MQNENSFYKMLLDNLHDGVYFVDEDRKISYWNKGAERITGFMSAEVLGKQCSEDILRHVDRQGKVLCMGACPLACTIADGTERNAEIFLHHKKGHRVPIFMRAAPIRDNGGAIVGGVEIFTDMTPAAAALERVAEFERLAYIDSLTEVANRRYTEITLNTRFEEMQRYGWPFGVVFVDIDRFKDINDRYGHDRGDEVLKMVSRTLQNSVRSFDLVGRWGGEEFIAVIANVDREQLLATVNRFRLLVEQSSISSVPGLRVTISLGATLARPGDDMTTIIKRADGLMYESKTAGRNSATVD